MKAGGQASLMLSPFGGKVVSAPGLTVLSLPPHSSWEKTVPYLLAGLLASRPEMYANKAKNLMKSNLIRLA